MTVCSMKTLIKIVLGMGLLLIGGYVIFPESRTWLAAVAPYLLVLACPLAMVFMMKSMNTPQEKEKKPDQDNK